MHCLATIHECDQPTNQQHHDTVYHNSQDGSLTMVNEAHKITTTADSTSVFFTREYRKCLHVNPIKSIVISLCFCLVL